MSEKVFETLLLEGFAAALADNTAARIPLAWRPDPADPYLQGEFGIYLETYPETEDDTITLAEYSVTDDVSLSDSVEGVQVMIRTKSYDRLRAVTSDVFDLFHGRTRGTLGEVLLISAVRSSGTNVGQDTSDRLGRSENYYLTVHRPSPNRI